MSEDYRDLERRLRRSAPKPPLSMDHRRRLRAELAELAAAPRARPRRPRAIAAVAALGLLFLVIQATPGGSGAFGMRVLGWTRMAGTVFAPRTDDGSHRTIATSRVETAREGDPAELRSLPADPGRAESDAERAQTALYSSDRKLVEVSGLTIGAETFLQAIYDSRLEDGTLRLPERVAGIPSAPLQRIPRFMGEDRLVPLIVTVHAGGATVVGAEDRFVGGKRVHMLKYLVHYPDYGDVIYWEWRADREG